MEKQKIVEEVARALRRPKRIEDAMWDALGSFLKEHHQEIIIKVLSNELERRTKSR